MLTITCLGFATTEKNLKNNLGLKLDFSQKLILDFSQK